MADKTITISEQELLMVQKSVQRYRTRIEEVGEMGWYGDPEVAKQEVEKVDLLLEKLQKEWH